MQRLKKELAKSISKLFICYYKLRYGKKVSFGRNIIINHKFKIFGPGKLIIGDNTNLYAHCEANSFHFYGQDAVITIGKNSRVNGLTCHSAASIEIGNNCLIGSSIIMDTDFHSFNDPSHILYNNPKTKPVKISNNVWIGGQSTVLKGCNIGEKSVVGFRTVVSKSFPDNVVIAGNPAQIVKRKNTENN